MHANVYSFWGQVEPRTEPSPSQRGKKKNKSAEREKGEHITERLRTYSFCCGPIHLKHECALNQHDSGEKVKQKNHAGNTKASRGESRIGLLVASKAYSR